MIISKKVRLLPTLEQETKMRQSAGTARFIYNWTLHKEMDNYKNGGKFIPDGKLRKEITQLKKGPLSWLKEVSNNVAKQAVKDCCNAYKKFFAMPKHFSDKVIKKAKRQNRELTFYDLEGHPKLKSKKRNKPSFYNDPIKLKVKNKTVLLEKIGWVKISESLPSVKYSNPRVTFDGKYWYISVGIEIEPSKVELTDKSLGIDLGIKDLAICSDGKVFKNINKTFRIKKLKKRLKRLHKQISRKYEKNKIEKGGSCQFIKTKNIEKLENKMRLLYRKLTNIRDNYIHQITTSIVKTKPYRIVIENLDIKSMMKNKYKAPLIQEQKWHKFRQYIAYKAEKNGIEFVLAERFFPSSKTCSCCGSYKSNLKETDRTYICDQCGLIIDRDSNASLNLANYNI